MKTPDKLFFFLLIFGLVSCGGGKNPGSEVLFGPTWELESLSGTDRGFQELFPDITPEIVFEQETSKVVGNSGCNGYQAPYTLNGEKIRFGEPGPSTLMFCGEGENLFRSLIQEVEHWRITDEGKLELLGNGTPLLRFRLAIRRDGVF